MMVNSEAHRADEIRYLSTFLVSLHSLRIVIVIFYMLYKYIYLIRMQN
jgi:hypothetical protein